MTDEERLKLMIDKADISDVVIRYATGIDMRDWDLYRSCFTDEIDVETDKSMHLKADEWVAKVRRLISGFKATQHISSNHVITVNGDEATCVSYLQAQHYLPSETGSNCITFGGYYVNALVRVSNVWKIRKCRVTFTWNDGNNGLFDEARRRYQHLEGSS